MIDEKLSFYKMFKKYRVPVSFVGVCVCESSNLTGDRVQIFVNSPFRVDKWLYSAIRHDLQLERRP